MPDDLRHVENPRERDELELAGAPAEEEDAPPAQRDPSRGEAAEEHLRRPGDDAWSDDDMVDDARG